jgi:hypothetical protein
MKKNSPTVFATTPFGGTKMTDEKKALTKAGWLKTTFTKFKHRHLLISIVAAIVLLWTITTLWFGEPPMSQRGLRANAITLILIWALAPVIWLVIEARIWKSEPGVAQAQQHERDFWFGAGAIILILAIRQLYGSASQPANQATFAWNLLVDAFRVAIWPLVTMVGFFLFREPLSAFFNALGTRASKIGAFAVSIELTTLPEAKPWSGPALEDLRLEYPTAAMDSSGSLFRAIADTAHADYITVNLGDGEAWLTSRLFILATLIPRVRPIKRIVFLSDPAELYVGEATPASLSQAFVKRYRWLEEAYIAAHVEIKNPPTKRPRAVPSPPEVVLQSNKTILGPLEPNLAGMILSSFLNKVRGTPAPTGWVKFSNYAEHAEWITVDSLTRLLGRNLNANALKVDPSLDETKVTRTLLRHRSQYVAIVDDRDRFQNLIDRYTALDQVVRRETTQALRQ